MVETDLVSMVVQPPARPPSQFTRISSNESRRPGSRWPTIEGQSFISALLPPIQHRSA